MFCQVTVDVGVVFLVVVAPGGGDGGDQVGGPAPVLVGVAY